MVRLRLQIFGKNAAEAICLRGDTNLDHLVLLERVGFLICAVTIFPFIINILVDIPWDCATILFLLKLSFF